MQGGREGEGGGREGGREGGRGREKRKGENEKERGGREREMNFKLSVPTKILYLFMFLRKIQIFPSRAFLLCLSQISPPLVSGPL